MPIKCCKDCVPSTRYLGCHAKCEQYKAEKAKWEEEKKLIKANKTVMITNYDFDEIAYASSKRHKRKSRE